MTPTTLATDSGVVTGCPSSVTCRPAGLVCSVIVEVRGRTSRKVVLVSPAGSRAVRWIRNQTLAETSPRVGTVNEPLVIPEVSGR